MCIGCDERLTIEHILLTSSDFIQMRERETLCFRIFRLRRFLNFLKEINIFGKI